MLKTISKKFYRLKTSRNYLKFIKLFHIIFGEKFNKKIPVPNIYDYSIHRKDIINQIINLKNFKDYLEIGCDQDELFSEVLIKNKIGVDPNNGGTHRMTSDDFFWSNNEKFDLIFIDGLHTYGQALKDIKNSLATLRENGFILLHDCFPMSYFDQAVPRAQRKWNGDVWKAITDLRQKEDLEIFTCEMDQGIGVIKKNKNSSILNLDKPINNLKFRDYYTNYKEYLRVISLEEFKKIF